MTGVDRALEPADILATLAEHRVEFVLIDGLAAIMHGSPTITADVDICASRSPRNLDRLAAALTDMEARIRTSTDPEGLEFARDGQFLARMKMVNLVTKWGHFDISFEPAGFTYETLAPRSIEMPVGGASVRVAALEDVIHSKELANRPKDRLTLPILRALADEIAAQERDDR
jgi:predicted transcriptional regulator